MEIRLKNLSIFTFLLTVSVSGCASQAQLPFRKECIVKVVSLAPMQTRFATGGLGGIKDLMSTAAKENIPLAGVSVKNNETLFLQYGSKCMSRFKMTNTLMHRIFKPSQISIVHKVIIPSMSTINISGPQWRDGLSQWPPTSNK